MKRLLFRFFPEGCYRLAQACTMAWDIRTRAWYEPEIDLLPYAVQPGDHALDVGANFGMYSYHLSRAVGRRGLVHAFEPVPWSCGIFRTVARLLRMHNVELVPLACGDRRDTVRFRIPLQDAGSISAGLAHLAEGDVAPSATFREREVQVEMTTLDDFFGEAEQFSFLKCDVEGAELLVMRGAQELIDRCHPTVLCEIVASRLAAIGGSVRELTQFFEERDYELYRLNRPQDGLKLVHIDAGGIVEGVDNYIFIHPSRLNNFSPLLATAAHASSATHASAIPAPQSVCDAGTISANATAAPKIASVPKIRV